MKRRLAILCWKVANKLARVGCWLRRSHIDPADFQRNGYCQQCGLRKDIWRLPSDAIYQAAANSVDSEGEENHGTTGNNVRRS